MQPMRFKDALVVSVITGTAQHLFLMIFFVAEVILFEMVCIKERRGWEQTTRNRRVRKRRGWERSRRRKMDKKLQKGKYRTS